MLLQCYGCQSVLRHGLPFPVSEIQAENYQRISILNAFFFWGVGGGSQCISCRYAQMRHNFTYIRFIKTYLRFNTTSTFKDKISTTYYRHGTLCYNHRNQFELNHYVKQGKAAEAMTATKFQQISHIICRTTSKCSFSSLICREIHDWRDCNRAKII